MKTQTVVPAESIALWQSLAGEELYAHLLYTQLAANLQAAGYFGSQKHFEDEADQELGHYKKVRDIVNSFNSVIFPTSSYQIAEKANTIGDALQSAYDTELDLLRKYESAKNAFEEADDQASYEAVLDFVQIQRESVGEVADLMKRYEIAVQFGGVIFFDQELGK